jgi:hypothetical protein
VSGGERGPCHAGIKDVLFSARYKGTGTFLGFPVGFPVTRYRRFSFVPSSSQGFFTAGYRAVYRGNRSYRWGTVTVPSGRNRTQNSNLKLNSKMKKSIKITKK